MDDLCQSMVFSLHIDENFDYDRHVREHPFIIPQQAQSAEISRLERHVGEGVVDERIHVKFSDMLVLQGVFIAWYQQFYPQFGALMRYIATKDLSDAVLRKILEYVQGRMNEFPQFLEEEDSSMTRINCYIAWAEWPEQAIDAYQLIADLVLNQPFPQVPMECHPEERKDRDELWGRIQWRVPGPLPLAWIRTQEEMLAKANSLDSTQDLIQKMSMVSLKHL